MSEERGFYSAGQNMNLARAIAERTIAYRPSLKNIAGSTNGAIILQQIAWFWYSNKEKPFYKFIQRCDHIDYRDGDSWCEELNFSYSEFTTAVAKFAFKIEAGFKKSEAEKQFIVIFWTDSDRKTWWQFNPKTFEQLYKVELLGNSENSNYLDNSNISNYFNGIKAKKTKEGYSRKTREAKADNNNPQNLEVGI